jgi:hypothetical protein
MAKEFLLVALLAIFSDVVVPRVTELATAPAKPQAEEPADDDTGEAAEVQESAEEDEGEAAEEDEVERLREENRTLKELVGEKELALRQAAD